MYHWQRTLDRGETWMTDTPTPADSLLWLQSWDFPPADEAAFLAAVKERLASLPGRSLLLRESELPTSIFALADGRSEGLELPPGPWTTTRAAAFQRVDPLMATPRPLPAPGQVTAVLLVGIESNPEIYDEFTDWYDLEHLPRLAASPGVLRSRRYTKVDNRYHSLAIYEFRDLDALQTEEWRSVARTPWMARIKQLYGHWLTGPRKLMQVIPLD
jgi:hypothetical protein